MSVVKFNIQGSNNDVENIIQEYIDDLKLKDKYDTVMNELVLVMDKPRCVFVTKNYPYYVYHCKNCNVFFADIETTNVECSRCMVNLLRDGILYSG